MQRKIITTSDGSKTIQISDWNEQYHSIHGAIQEAKHVFIKTGLYPVMDANPNPLNGISILEVGFGTGLNAYLTLLESSKQNLRIIYVGVEAFPVNNDEVSLLNYPEIVKNQSQDALFDALHSTPWEKPNSITSNFTLTKRLQFFKDIDDDNAFDLIYFDAFGARVQPELWTQAMFDIMFKALKPKGVLVTYSAKGSVRRAMQTVGFAVERLPGPPGKREMLRAVKPE